MAMTWAQQGDKVAEPIDSRYTDLYPETEEGKRLNFRPGSKLHDSIRDDLLMPDLKESARSLTPRHDTWDKINEMLTSYIPTDEKERLTVERDTRTPVSIVIPESLATLNTILTYMVAAFLSETPITPLEAESPEDTLGVILLEHLVDKQMRQRRAGLALHTQWRDAFAYGIGAVHLPWETRTGKRTVTEPTMNGPVRSRIDTMLFEGTVVEPIDPYFYLPDHNVPLADVQRGEFVGWVQADSYMNLLAQEKEPDSLLFNVEFLDGRILESTLYKDSTTGRRRIDEQYGGAIDANLRSRKIDVAWVYRTLIPKRWKLGRSERPEKWLFAIAGDEIIIAAAPLNLDHNEYPVAVCAPDSGGHEHTPISRLETLYPLNHLMDWYINSHVKNAEQVMRSRFIYDPTIINSRALRMGALNIPTKRSMWGRSIKDGLEQLKVTDVTSGHLPDLMLVRDLARNAVGSVDALQGIQRTKGERVTGQEFGATFKSALSRLQTDAWMIGQQSMYSVGLQFASNTQQLMSMDTYVKIVGEAQQLLQQEYGVVDDQMLVTPFDLNVGYDVVVRDGSTGQGDSAADFIQLFQIIANSPELMQTLDVPRIYMSLARRMGEKNMGSFIRNGGQANITGAPNEQVAQQAQAGNIVPFGATG